MGHYLSAELNQGRYGSNSVVSPAGMAELQRAGVPTGHEGVSYAMGWDVRETNGIHVLSHDGSMFNAHANVVLVPDGKWGIVLLENAENSPDEFFGARRMSGIADGVTSLVKGKQPEAAGSNIALRVVYGIVLAILALQIAAIVRSVRKLRRGTGCLRGGRTVSFGSPLPSGPSCSEPALGPGRARCAPEQGSGATLGAPHGIARPRLPARGQRRPRACLEHHPRRLGERHPPGRPPRRSGRSSRHDRRRPHSGYRFGPAAALELAPATPTRELLRPGVSDLVGPVAPARRTRCRRSHGPGFRPPAPWIPGSFDRGDPARRRASRQDGHPDAAPPAPDLARRCWLVGGDRSAVGACSRRRRRERLARRRRSGCLHDDPRRCLLFLFSIFPGSAGGEELGWRGFALPYLQRGRSALGASVVLGLAWGFWHLPLYLTGADFRPLSLFAPWVVAAVAASIIYTWIYNGTGGSLLIVVLFHAASNVLLTVFLVQPFDDEVARPFLIYVALMIVAASVVTAATGPAALSRTHAKQVGEPGTA